MHYIYKEKWACFGCRKSFKQRNWRQVPAHHQPPPGQVRVVLCPQCGEPMKNMGWDFKAPKQKDVKQWEKVRLLAQHGFLYHSLCCGEPHKGPGFRPARLQEVKAFLEQEKRRADKDASSK